MPPKERKLNFAWVKKGDPPTYGYEFVERVKCGCGGSHLRCGTPERAQSYRQHIATERHMRWLQDAMPESVGELLLYAAVVRMNSGQQHYYHPWMIERDQ